MKKFEKGFLVGAATAAHQVEGNNVNSDCWAMEHMEHTSFVEPSLDAVDHYNRYEEDIRLMKEAGLNAYRFSIEWARIQPEENRFAEEEIEHYRKVIRCCKENGLEPVVTLHHFSSPRWLIGKGGWEAETVPEDFARYVRYVCERLGEEFHYVCTINEANMGVQVAAVAKRYMMQMMAKMKQAQAGAAASGGFGQASAASAENGEAASAQPGGGASADGSVQMGINLEKMMAGQQEAAEENRKVFGVAKVENFTSPRTERGDQLVMEAHRAARAAISSAVSDLSGLSPITCRPSSTQASKTAARQPAAAIDPFFNQSASLLNSLLIKTQMQRSRHHGSGPIMPHLGECFSAAPGGAWS